MKNLIGLKIIIAEIKIAGESRGDTCKIQIKPWCKICEYSSKHGKENHGGILTVGNLEQVT